MTSSEAFVKCFVFPASKGWHRYISMWPHLMGNFCSSTESLYKHCFVDTPIMTSPALKLLDCQLARNAMILGHLKAQFGVLVQLAEGFHHLANAGFKEAEKVSEEILKIIASPSAKENFFKKISKDPAFFSKEQERFIQRKTMATFIEGGHFKEDNTGIKALEHKLGDLQSKLRGHRIDLKEYYKELDALRIEKAALELAAAIVPLKASLDNIFFELEHHVEVLQAQPPAVVGFFISAKSALSKLYSGDPALYLTHFLEEMQNGEQPAASRFIGRKLGEFYGRQKEAEVQLEKLCINSLQAKLETLPTDGMEGVDAALGDKDSDDEFLEAESQNAALPKEASWPESWLYSLDFDLKYNQSLGSASVGGSTVHLAFQWLSWLSALEQASQASKQQQQLLLNYLEENPSTLRILNRVQLKKGEGTRGLTLVDIKNALNKNTQEESLEACARLAADALPDPLPSKMKETLGASVGRVGEIHYNKILAAFHNKLLGKHGIAYLISDKLDKWCELKVTEEATSRSLKNPAGMKKLILDAAYVKEKIRQGTTKAKLKSWAVEQGKSGIGLGLIADEIADLTGFSLRKSDLQAMMSGSAEMAATAITRNLSRWFGVDISVEELIAAQKDSFGLLSEKMTRHTGMKFSSDNLKKLWETRGNSELFKVNLHALLAQAKFVDYIVLKTGQKVTHLFPPAWLPSILFWTGMKFSETDLKHAFQDKASLKAFLVKELSQNKLAISEAEIEQGLEGPKPFLGLMLRYQNVPPVKIAKIMKAPSALIATAQYFKKRLIKETMKTFDTISGISIHEQGVGKAWSLLKDFLTGEPVGVDMSTTSNDESLPYLNEQPLHARIDLAIDEAAYSVFKHELMVKLTHYLEAAEPWAESAELKSLQHIVEESNRKVAELELQKKALFEEYQAALLETDEERNYLLKDSQHKFQDWMQRKNISMMHTVAQLSKWPNCLSAKAPLAAVGIAPLIKSMAEKLATIHAGRLALKVAVEHMTLNSELLLSADPVRGQLVEKSIKGMLSAHFERSFMYLEAFQGSLKHPDELHIVVGHSDSLLRRFFNTIADFFANIFVVPPMPAKKTLLLSDQSQHKDDSYQVNFLSLDPFMTDKERKAFKAPGSGLL